MKAILLSFVLSSPAFHNNDSMPVQYTCDGKNQSPPLAWSGLPEGTKSLALFMDDYDVQQNRFLTLGYNHWIVYNIPVTTNHFSAGEIPVSALEGFNDSKKKSYIGPCPPKGRHRYHFTLYALDKTLPNFRKPTKTKVLAAIQAHVLARAELMITYQKDKSSIQNSVYWTFNWRLALLQVSSWS